MTSSGRLIGAWGDWDTLVAARAPVGHIPVVDRATELARATTQGQALPLGIDDPVVAARAVRRALAAAGRHAADVRTIVIAAPEPITPGMLASFSRRALGPHGATVAYWSIVCPDEGATALADRAAEDVAASMATGEGIDPVTGEGLAIVIGLDARGTTEARVLGTCAGAGSAPSG